MQKRMLVWIVTALALLVHAGRARADIIDYAATTAGELGTLDLQTGVFTSIGNSGFLYQDLTRLPGGTLYAVDNSHNLRTVNTSDGSSVVVGNMGDGIFGIKLRSDGTMFALSNTTLYTVNPSTAAATLIGTTGVNLYLYDLAFSSPNELYLSGAPVGAGNSSLYMVNQTTGNATLVGASNVYAPVLDYENGTLYGITFTTGSQEIVTFNTTTGAATVLSTITGVTDVEIYGIAPAAAVATVPEPSSLLTMSVLSAAGFFYAFATRRKSSVRLVKD